MVKLSFIGIGEASTIMPAVQPIMDVMGSVKKAQASTATSDPANVPSIDFDSLNGEGCLFLTEAD